MKLLTKVTKGIEYGDVSNSSVRNILTQISKQVYGKITEQDMIDALDYFDWKCPYTGRDLRYDIENGISSYAVDHIVPQNKDFCGLNAKGNLAIIDKEANNAKGKETVEDFLLNDTKVLRGVPKTTREERLKAIKDFQKQFGYDPEAIRKKLSPYLNKIYDDSRKEQEQRIEEAINIAGLTKLVPIKNINKTTKGLNTSLIFIPSNEEIFKKELLSSKKARITLTYETGRVEQRIWNAQNLDVTSNIRGNIQSTPFWRKKKVDGLVRVLVEII